MYYSYVEIEYVAASFSPARTDLALKLIRGKCFVDTGGVHIRHLWLSNKPSLSDLA